MFDINWSEIAVIAVVAVVFIGPKDLPKVLRAVGQGIGKARSLAREFQNGLDEMIREAELDEAKKQIQSFTSVDLNSKVEEVLDPKGEIKAAMNEAGSAMNEAGSAMAEASSVSPPAAALEVTAAPEIAPAATPAPETKP